MTLRTTRFIHGWNRRAAVALLVASVAAAVALSYASAAFANTLGEVTEFHSGIDEGETHGITLGGEGELWFTQKDTPTPEIGRITPAGVATEFPTGVKGFPDGEGITTGHEGDLWFTMLSGQGIGQMTPTGETTIFPITGGEPEFVAITTGTGGELWFTQDFVKAVWEMTPGGSAEQYFTPTAWSTPDYDSQGITVGHEGDIWFTEYSAHAIGRLDPTTRKVTQFTTGLPSGAEPVAIATGPEGDLWFTEDGGPGAVGRITPSGSVTNFKTEGLSSPDGIAAGPEGDMWFTDIHDSKIGRIAPSGEVMAFAVGNLNAGSKTPMAITAGAEGNMWVTQGESDEIGRIGTGNGALRPTVTKVEPDKGYAEGGTEVTITGLNLEGVNAVSFGSTPALEVPAVSATTVTAIAPPGTAGTTVNVTVSSGGGTSAISHSDRFKYLPDPLKLGPKSLKLATAGVPYTDALHATGGTEPYTFKLVSGTPPAGIELSPSGELTGTPEAAGTSTFVVKVTDSSVPAFTATREYTLETQLDITPSSLGRLTAGTPVSKAFTVTGGTGPYTLSLLGLGTIGLGFSFDTATDQGLLSGVPSVAGTYTITAQATDSASPQHSGTRTFRVKVHLALLPAALADGKVGEPYESQIEVIGGSGSYSYAVSEGTPPAGVELNPLTGKLSG